MEAGRGSPTKTPAALSPLAVPSTTPWAHREYQLFCCERVALPTTAAAKEREGKPGYGPQPKIDTIYKNQATHLGLVYKNIVYTQSRCLPKGYFWTKWTTDILYLNELSSMKNSICPHYSLRDVQSILNCKYPMCADCV